MMPNIGVLALQGDFLEHSAVLRRLNVDAREVRLPGQLGGLDGLIIPGGESTTIARLMHEWDLIEPVRRAARAGMAVWGTCAGAILLAERVGDLDREGLRLMDITVERNAFGRQVDSFEADLEVAAFGPPAFHAVFIRAPVISAVGAQAEALATLGDGTVVAAQQDGLLATSFHPELTNDTRFHEFFLTLASSGRRSAPERSHRSAAR